MVDAEYEAWLLAETQHCTRAGAMLREPNKRADSHEVATRLSSYCGDCEAEWASVRDKASGLM